MINTNIINFNDILNINKIINFSTRYPNTEFVPTNSLQHERCRLSSAQIKSFSKSLVSHGFFDPVTVNEDGLVLDGTKRICAAKYADINNVPVITGSGQLFLSHLLLNRLDSASDFFEYADILAMLNNDFCFSRDYLALYTGLSVSAISNKIRLISFTQSERQLILSFSLSERHARTILKLSPYMRFEAIKHVGEARLNVADTEDYILSLVSPTNNLYSVSLRALENDILKLCKKHSRHDLCIDLSKQHSHNSTSFVIHICER